MWRLWLGWLCFCSSAGAQIAVPEGIPEVNSGTPEPGEYELAAKASISDARLFETLRLRNCVRAQGDEPEWAFFNDRDWDYSAEELALRGFVLERVQACEYQISYKGYSRVLYVIRDRMPERYRLPAEVHEAE
jgi:hypothetical protein